MTGKVAGRAFGGRPLRGGRATPALSSALAALSRKVETFSVRSPTWSSKTRRERRRTLYGPSYLAERGVETPSLRTRTISASSKASGRDSGSPVRLCRTGRGAFNALWRILSRKTAFGGSGVSRYSPGNVG